MINDHLRKIWTFSQYPAYFADIMECFRIPLNAKNHANYSSSYSHIGWDDNQLQFKSAYDERDWKFEPANWMENGFVTYHSWEFTGCQGHSQHEEDPIPEIRSLSY